MFLFKPLFQLFSYLCNDSTDQGITHQEGSLSVIYSLQLGVVGGEHIEAF